MPRTVVIVDDHAPFRASARKLLEVEGYEVIGEAADAASAVETVERLRPDVVLLDVVLPDGSGFDVAEQLVGSEVTVVLVSSRDRSDLGSRLRRSSAAGFVPKDELSAETLAELL
jgi:DNA-binding NarL/FixJ family response regulator